MGLESLKNTAVKQAVRGIYYLVSALDPGSNTKVLNYGYYDRGNIPLDSEDLANHLRLALYHHVVSAVDMSNKDVLEVGSGRGGGASYLARHLGPRTVRGVDLSGKAVRFCQEYYDVPGLSFSEGDAERLDLEDSSVDVVINIESSHNYPDMRSFVDEAYRVLRPDGHFLLADLRSTDKVMELRNFLDRPGFRIISEEDITQNVLSALDRDNPLKNAYIARNIPRLLRTPFSIFAGSQGTHFYNRFQDGTMKYTNFVLQKE